MTLTFFLLPVTPYPSERLLIGGRVPVCEQSDHGEKGLRSLVITVYSPGSNNISLFAPMRLMPQPPALLLSKNTNSPRAGSLN